MTKKIGRNDPCPCGSGKKYKNCCMKKEQEQQSAAKYTAAGKRKFKAKVLNVDTRSLGVFGQSAPTQQEMPSEKETFAKLRFRMTKSDYQKKAEEKSIQFETSSEQPKERERHLPKEDEEFNPTQEDFRKKK